MRLTSLALAAVMATKAGAGTVRVWIAAGQSNMDGFASASGLPSNLQQPQPDVLYRPSSGPMTTLRPVDGRFGPEITFGQVMAKRTLDDVAIIKYAKGSTSLAEDWAADGIEYERLMLRVDSSLGYLRSIGLTPKLAGFLWMQGEEDAWHQDMALAYEDNLRGLIGRVREDLGYVPFSIGRINAPFREYRDEVRIAQRDVLRTTAGVTLVETEVLELQDKVHLNPNGQMVLGRRFAKAFYQVEQLGTQRPASHLTPEPSTGVLAALAGLVGWMWRKAR